MPLQQQSTSPEGRGTAGRATSLLWFTAACLGVLVLAAIAATRIGTLPVLPARVVLGLSVPLLFLTALAAVGKGPRPRGAPFRRDESTSDEQPDRRGSPEADSVYRWRYERLASLGVERHVALLLAADPRYSVHELERLLALGCPLGIALRILRPV